MRAVLIAAVCMVGCYSPHYGDCEVSCASNVCPSGLDCLDGMCRVSGMTGSCGMTGEPDAAVGGPIPIENLAAAQRDAVCDWLVRCHSFEDLAACRSTFGSQLDAGNLVEAVKANKVRYDGAKARECVDSFAASTCERARMFSNRDIAQVCNEVLTGTIAELAQCFLDEECISQECNIPNCPNQCCAGTCMGASPPGQPTVGQQCTSKDRCVDSYCSQGTNRVCTAYKQSNIACTSSDECLPGLSCLGSPMICRALTPTNGPCGSISECATLADVCQNGKCTTGGLTGFACADTNGCQQQHICSTMGTTAGMCGLLPTIDESCGFFPTCREGYCNSTGVCEAKKPNGSPCTAAGGSVQCASNYCDTAIGMCTARPVCI